MLSREQRTAILVTHDQNEAFAMADQIFVMNEGSVQQQGSGYDLYHRPQTRFVADFIGQGVIVPATVETPTTVRTVVGVSTVAGTITPWPMKSATNRFCGR